MKKNNALCNKVFISLFFIASFLFSCNANNSDNLNVEENSQYFDEAINFDDDNQKVSTKNSEIKFVEGSKDIPLAFGLSKISDDGLDFDSVAGSVIFVTYKSSDNLEKVKDFYSKNLPEMGWKKVDSSESQIIKFKRDNEKLEIEFINYNGEDVVKFFVETTSN